MGPRLKLAADIRRWRDYILAPTVAAFQDMVADYLESGWVQTFREIATLVDEE